jgi:hypothetical protein
MNASPKYSASFDDVVDKCYDQHFASGAKKHSDDSSTDEASSESLDLAELRA